jgi:hypothetical protein
MEKLMVLRTFGAVTTVPAAALVAANVNAHHRCGLRDLHRCLPRLVVDGWLESKASLVIQNAILLLINAAGAWRWFPKAEKEAKS